MERLTTNKSVADMSMIELAHNSCYADDERNARYRDYNLDVDSRWLIRNLVKDICGEDFKDLSDEEVDEYMASMLSVEIDSTIGLLASFYHNLWAMTDLREKLKYYEDAEEQGLLLRLPISEDTPVYSIEYCCGNIKSNLSGMCFRGFCENCSDKAYYIRESVAKHCSICEINKSVFFTHEEAEAKLKEMEEKSMIKGKKVVMNDKYYVSEKNKGKIFEVTSEPYSVCGTVVVKLKGLSGCYALDGLDEVKDGR